MRVSQSILFQITVEDVLTYDIVKIYAQALSELDQNGIPLSSGTDLFQAVANRTHTSLLISLALTLFFSIM